MESMTQREVVCYRSLSRAHVPEAAISTDWAISLSLNRKRLENRRGAFRLELTMTHVSFNPLDLGISRSALAPVSTRCADKGVWLIEPSVPDAACHPKT
jgi:hypothetical protein